MRHGHDGPGGTGGLVGGGAGRDDRDAGGGERLEPAPDDPAAGAVVHLVHVVDDEQAGSLGHRERDAEQEGVDLVEVPDDRLDVGHGPVAEDGREHGVDERLVGAPRTAVPRRQPREALAHVGAHGDGVVQLVDPGEAGQGRLALDGGAVGGQR